MLEKEHEQQRLKIVTQNSIVVYEMACLFLKSEHWL